MSAAAPGREAGFSLVEILVSVFVFAVIGTISVALMASSVGAREINSDVLERTAMIDRARTLLREDLGQIARRAVRDEAGYRDPWILAGAATGLADYETDATERVLMVFTRHGRANPGLIRPRSSLVHVTYLIRGGDLVRRVRDYPDPGEATRITRPGADRGRRGFLHRVSRRRGLAEPGLPVGGRPGRDAGRRAPALWPAAAGGDGACASDTGGAAMSRPVLDSHRERGASLASALLLVAVMASLAMALAGDLRFAMRRSANMDVRDQAYWYAIGAREFTEGLIARAMDDPRQALRPDADWLNGPRTFPIEQGALTGRVRDGNNCFNPQQPGSGRRIGRAAG